MEQIQTILDELRGLAVNYTLTPLLKRRIEELHLKIMGYVFYPTRCGDCYRDAAILCYNTLKKTNTMAQEKKFLLKRGILLQPEFGKGKFYTRLTLTDELAMEYLTKNPTDVYKFEKVDKEFVANIGKEKPQEKPQTMEVINDTPKEQKPQEVAFKGGKKNKK